MPSLIPNPLRSSWSSMKNFFCRVYSILGVEHAERMRTEDRKGHKESEKNLAPLGGCRASENDVRTPVETGTGAYAACPTKPRRSWVPPRYKMDDVARMMVEAVLLSGSIVHRSACALKRPPKSIPEFHCGLSLQTPRLKIRLRLDYLNHRFHRGDHGARLDLSLRPFPQGFARCRQAEQIGIFTSCGHVS